MNNQDLIIIALIIAIIYLYYQNRQNLNQNQRDQSFTSFLKEQLNSNNLAELQTKLGEKTLNELLEENEDYETEVDTLTRTKNSLEADLLAQSNSFQNRLREKDRELKRSKEELTNVEKRAEETQKKLTSEKQQHKGSLARITKLTEKKAELEKNHQEQLRKINLLFDEKAKDYKTIDFNGLYSLLEKVVDKPEIKEAPMEEYGGEEKIEEEY